MNRRKWSGLAVALALVVALAPPSAWASEVHALRNDAVSDPRGDVPDCHGDITFSSVDYRSNGSGLFVSVYPACRVPVNSYTWPAGSNVEWRLDTSGDGVADFLIRLQDGDQGTTLRDLRTGATLCDPVGQFGTDGGPDSGATTISVYVEGSCIGGPPSVSVAASATWGGGPVDLAPDGGGFGPSVSAGANPSPPPPPPPPPAPARKGYWMIGRTGDTYAFGDAGWYGNTNAPADVVDLEPTLSGNGYWTIDSLGHLYAFGDAEPFSALPDASGSPTQARPGERVTSVSRSVEQSSAGLRVIGLWGFTTRGRVIRYGRSHDFRDLSTKALNGEVVDSIATPDGGGYYMVATDGGIFTFGNAEFLGSMGDTRLNAPVQSLVPDADGRGYWLVASDGGIFTFDATFLGSMGGTRLNQPVTGMVSFGSGYLMVATDGGIFTFGDAPFFGSLGDHPPAQPIVSVAVLDDPGGYR